MLDPTGENSVREMKVRDEWPALVTLMRDAMNRRLSPRDHDVQKLAQRWMDLLRRTVSEDPELLHEYDGTQRLEPGVRPRSGVDVEMLDYLSAALWSKHLTLEESKRLRTNGPKHRKWPHLLSALRHEMNHGVSVTSPTVQHLYRQWENTLDELTAGDLALRHKWMTAARSDPDLLVGAGIDTRLQNYLRRAHMARDERAERAA